MFTPHVLTEEPGAEKFWARNRNLVHNLVPVNYLTLCAATLPVGLDRLGMPVGMQFIAKGGDDERLATIACAVERVLAIHARFWVCRRCAGVTLKRGSVGVSPRPFVRC
jgi:Asp-tRNA(Asn)/Glu-tRNA(Gln) amidotransferase A subunit family amidase